MPEISEVKLTAEFVTQANQNRTKAEVDLTGLVEKSSKAENPKAKNSKAKNPKAKNPKAKDTKAKKP